MVKKNIVMTFKADGPLLKALGNIPNRSEFIRSAILSALNNACPLCGGTGIFTPDQRKHWELFNKNHVVEQCGDCHAVHIVCKEGGEEGSRRNTEGRSSKVRECESAKVLGLKKRSRHG